jgi:hypothetical protein
MKESAEAGDLVVQTTAADRTLLVQEMKQRQQGVTVSYRLP